MALKYDFNGYLALVTGAGSGMGRLSAQELAQSGAEVIVADINLEGANETVKGLKGKNHAAFKVDVTSESSVNDLVKFVKDRYKRCPTVVLHAAGMIATGALNSVFEIDCAQFQRSIDVNLKGTFLIDRAFGRWMRDDKVEHGSIVNFSSLAGKTGVPFLADYCAAKTGVNSLTESFGKELASAGIRVNAVAPFFIPTPLLVSFPDEKLQRAAAVSPSKRLGTMEEVVRVCMFLASKESSYVNAQIIQITGGA